VAEAARIGLTAVALTDHDSTAGIGLFLDACRGTAVLGVPGVEISADIEHGTMHILGYFIDHQHAGLESMLVEIRDGRQIRNRKILTKLNELGMELTFEEVAAYAGDEVVGRPHFASAMIAKGYARSKQQVFDQYLAKGKPAYVSRFRLLPQDCIRVIREAGGVPVLAHPLTLGLGEKALRALVGEFRGMGLEGIEVYYSEHNEGVVRQYLKLAQEFDLVVTGGTDYHGTQNPDIRLGVGFGSMRVPDELVGALRSRANVGRP
jgi:predicted metal-dependent phosphoesterase TrpH